MRYFVVFLGLGVALATAGLIQVLWLELTFIRDGVLLPDEGVADESSENRHAAGIAHLDTSMSDAPDEAEVEPRGPMS
jgi:hypothetical protein